MKSPTPEWVRRQERSNLAILKFMVWLSLFFGRSASRIVLYGIAVYYVIFAPQARRASRNYLRRALGRWANWRDGFLHVFSFASTVHDRIYLLNDRFDLFDIEEHGAEQLRQTLAEGHGALLIGAHMGSFEVLRAIGRGREGLKVAMMMYEENARKINATLEAINPAATKDIIGLGQPGSMIAARDKLDQGYLVGMLADRRLGDDVTTLIDFLGAPAPFPVGPFRVAAMLKRPVFFMTGLYMGGNRYQIHFERLADFTQVERAERDDAIHAAQQAYADRLSHFCRQAPYNWFNFFDFWQDK